MKVCEQCKAEFAPSDYRQRFCNHSCAAKFSNLARGNKLRALRPDCIICGNKLRKNSKMTCSVSCRGKYARKVKIDKWLSGDASVASKKDGNLAPWARFYLMEEANWTCDCGWNKPNPVLGRPILTVDHINGVWNDNRRENLKVMCYSCHTLTPTFGALNVGSASGRRPGQGNRRNMSLLDSADALV